MRFRSLAFAALASLMLLAHPHPASAEAALRLIGLGDSLMAGYGLDGADGFPARLQAALEERGHAVEIIDAGVSGDTTSGGLARLDWSIPDDVDGVILELGANDALRGLPPETTRENLRSMIERLQARDIPVLLAGMLAPPNMGADYEARFNTIYPELAEEYGLVLYPFFLDGVTGDTAMLLPDGMHPNAQGVEKMVENILPYAEEFLSRVTVE
ncbi:arylesterase [uncultured Hoeflea sp.]|uniref:arylesterase n=1 Tax=uncultured Hoeflea sp. TaxID=538666 RepID=UPI002611D983|nr:arylesterase [uncultured Hoeflea sp.]